MFLFSILIQIIIPFSYYIHKICRNIQVEVGRKVCPNRGCTFYHLKESRRLFDRLWCFQSTNNKSNSNKTLRSHSFVFTFLQTVTLDVFSVIRVDRYSLLTIHESVINLTPLSPYKIPPKKCAFSSTTCNISTWFEIVPVNVKSHLHSILT